MARVTVEDCVLVVPNRFELCLIASNRAKSILSGSPTEINKKDEKPSVLALREIAANLIDIDKIRSNIISNIKNKGGVNDNNMSEEDISADNVLEMMSSEMISDKEVDANAINAEIEE